MLIEISNIMPIDKKNVDLFFDKTEKCFFGYGRGDNFEAV